MKKSRVIAILFIAILIMLIPLTIKATSQIPPESYEPVPIKKNDVVDMYNFGGRIAGAVQIIGTAVSAGTLLIIGIRYAVASVDEKAEYKERMGPYLIGAVLLFGATNIVGIIYNMSKK